MTSAVGRRALVTGASRGIGAAIAHRLARDGFELILLGRSEASLRATRDRIAGDGGTSSLVRCDLSDRQGLARAVAEVGAEPLAALVNCAGVAVAGPLPAQTGCSWDDVLAVNLTAPFEFTVGLVPALASARGCVVNVGSGGGERVSTGLAGYCVAKAGLHHLTRILAVELGPRGVRVNAVAPGAVATDMYEQGHPPERKRAFAAAIPLRRVAAPAEVASVVSFLCSPDSAYVSGAVIPVDGAASCRMAMPDVE